MSEVLQVEQLSFQCPWSEDDFLRALRQRNVICMIAERGEKVIGFIVYALEKHLLRVIRIAVHPGHRRTTVATQIVDKMKTRLASHRRRRITLEIRETNVTGQLFFRTQDFRCTGTTKGFYDDSGEDALLMQYRLKDESGEEVFEAVSEESGEQRP